MVNVAVLGARGYLGRESIRILLAHPEVDAVTPVSGSESGKPYGDLVPGFRGQDLKFVAPHDPAIAKADVLILATDAEEAKKAVAAAGAQQLVIDLSRAHRHEALAGMLTAPKQAIAVTAGGTRAASSAASAVPATTWLYGQPDLLPVPQGHKRIANPGCYPTATMLAAAPALAGGFTGPGVLISDGKSGVSGAGATPRSDLHFPEANESVRAYKVLGHDHLGEIRLAAAAFESKSTAGTTRNASTPRPVRFTPHLVPANRGLLATVYLPAKTGIDAAAVKEAYAGFYDGTLNSVVAEPDTVNVRGTNRAEVAVDVDAEAGLIVARCAIDNLVKGGSGNAIQNLNAALGFEPHLGLPVLGGGP